MSDTLRDRLYSTEAIVLSRRNLGEADRIYDVFTARSGRVSIIAKGARKPESRNGRSLDLLNQVVVHLYHGRNLETVRGVETIATHPGLRTDLDAFGHACYLADLVRAMTHEHEPSEAVYTLLAQTLSLLSDGVDPWPVTRYFEYALLGATGFQAQLYECVRCREPLTAQVNAFSVNDGGVICPRCRVGEPGSIPLSVNAQKYLRTMQREGLRRILTLRLDPDSQMQVQRALAEYLQHLAERSFSSLAVLHALQEKQGPNIGEGERDPAPIQPESRSDDVGNDQ